MYENRHFWRLRVLRPFSRSCTARNCMTVCFYSVVEFDSAAADLAVERLLAVGKQGRDVDRVLMGCG